MLRLRHVRVKNNLSDLLFFTWGQREICPVLQSSVTLHRWREKGVSSRRAKRRQVSAKFCYECWRMQRYKFFITKQMNYCFFLEKIFPMPFLHWKRVYDWQAHVAKLPHLPAANRHNNHSHLSSIINHSSSIINHLLMYTGIFRVVSQAEAETYSTSTGNQSQKRQICLQELGGYTSNDNQSQRISNGFTATAFGYLAKATFYPNELVAATLRFSASKYQGQWYQDVTIADIVPLKQP